MMQTTVFIGHNMLKLILQPCNCLTIHDEQPLIGQGDNLRMPSYGTDPSQ